VDGESPERIRLIDLPDYVTEFDWHPDGRRLMIAMGRSDVGTYDVETGLRLRKMEMHEGFTHYLEMSPRGDYLLTKGWDNRTCLSDAESGEVLLEFYGPYPRRSFSGDGARIAGYAGRSVEIFEVNRSRLYHPLAGYASGGGRYYGIAMSPDDRLAAACDDEKLTLWDVETGAVLAEEVKQGENAAVAFSKDGGMLLSIRNADEVRRWSVLDGGRLKKLEPLKPRGINHCYIGQESSDGRWLSFATESDGRLIDLENPSKIEKIVSSISVDSNFRFSVSADRSLAAYTGWHSPGIRVWELESGDEIASLPGLAGGAQFSPDSQWLVAVNNKEAVFWNTEDWSKEAVYQRSSDTASYCLGIEWSKDGRLVALGGEAGKIQLLDGRPESLGRELATLKVPFTDRIYRMAFSSDGGRLVASGSNGRCHVWDVEMLEEELRARKLHWEQDVGISFRDGLYGFPGSEEGQLWCLGCLQSCISGG